MLGLALGLTGCAGVNLFSLSEEWQMGRQLEQQVNREVRLVNDRALSAYVSRMGHRIVRETPMADRRWTFHVVADDAINAFNIPGGYVYVNTGLIANAGSASELAGVMAHEIAHGVERHGTEQMTKARGLNVGASLLLGRDPSALGQVATQVAAGGAIASFSRSDEREADALGIRYLYRAGYDPRGMARLFERLQRAQQRRPGAVSQFFSTHPLTSERVEDAARRAERLRRRSTRGLVTNDRDFARMQRRAARY